jgi:hypothetical protein
VLLVDVFLEAHAAAPGEIVIDLDTTNSTLHGHRKGLFFHGTQSERFGLCLFERSFFSWLKGFFSQR